MDPIARGPSDHEHLCQGDYVPLFLSPIPLSLTMNLTTDVRPILDLLLTYFFTEGT